MLSLLINVQYLDPTVFYFNSYLHNNVFQIFVGIVIPNASIIQSLILLILCKIEKFPLELKAFSSQAQWNVTTLIQQGFVKFLVMTIYFSKLFILSPFLAKAYLFALPT